MFVKRKVIFSISNVFARIHYLFRKIPNLDPNYPHLTLTGPNCRTIRVALSAFVDVVVGRKCDRIFHQLFKDLKDLSPMFLLVWFQLRSSFSCRVSQQRVLPCSKSCRKHWLVWFQLRSSFSCRVSQQRVLPCSKSCRKHWLVWFQLRSSFSCRVSQQRVLPCSKSCRKHWLVWFQLRSPFSCRVSQQRVLPCSKSCRKH